MIPPDPIIFLGLRVFFVILFIWSTVMTEKQALYYKICYEKGNIAAAAESLFVSRSVVSRMVSELEKEFGATFFKRGKNGVKPT